MIIHSFEIVIWLLFLGAIIMLTQKRTPLLKIRKRRFFTAFALLLLYYLAIGTWYFLSPPIHHELFWMQAVLMINFLTHHWRWHMKSMVARHFIYVQLWVFFTSVFFSITSMQDVRSGLLMTITLLLITKAYKTCVHLLETHQHRYDLLLIRFLKAKHFQSEKNPSDDSKSSVDRAFFQAKKMEALGQLASGIAHDFNNLLASITGYTDLIRKKSLDNPKIVTYTQTILKASDKAAQMISQLLAFARRGRNQAMSISMNQSLREVLLLIEHSLDKRIQINTHFESSEPIILADPEQFQNAVINLVLNARDAMPDGGSLQIITSTTSISSAQALTFPFDVKPDHYATISIQDNGIGMTPEVKERIFEPFFTTKGVGKGTGLGLAGVYGFVKEHNGFIIVESSLHKGTEFTLYFPLISEPLMHIEVEAPKEPEIPLGKGLILVVDDEEMICALLEESLNSAGYQVITAHNGLECMEKISTLNGAPDLILLDMIMPGMSGKECFYQIRKIYEHQKILLCSGYSANQEIQKLLDDGAIGFMKKPFSLDELNQKIHDLLYPKQTLEGFIE